MPIIKLTDIEKIYHMGDEEVIGLKQLNVTIETGEFVAIMGASGSGKSTLLNILGCLDPPSSGKYELNGENVQDLDVNRLADMRNTYIGFIFQSFHLLPHLNLIKNVELPLLYNGISRNERRERAVHALEQMGLGNRLDHKPNELSGGQRQRTAIARALVNNPAIILADEPTGNLDSDTTQEIMTILKQLNDNNVSIVLVTHEEELVPYTDRVITLKDGRMIEGA